MCGSLMNHNYILFEAVFLDNLIELSKDKVSLVRISLACIIGKH
jgi:hypothetical protein